MENRQNTSRNTDQYTQHSREKITAAEWKKNASPMDRYLMSVLCTPEIYKVELDPSDDPDPLEYEVQRDEYGRIVHISVTYEREGIEVQRRVSVKPDAPYEELEQKLGTLLHGGRFVINGEPIINDDLRTHDPSTDSTDAATVDAPPSSFPSGSALSAPSDEAQPGGFGPRLPSGEGMRRAATGTAVQPRGVAPGGPPQVGHRYTASNTRGAAQGNAGAVGRPVSTRPAGHHAQIANPGVASSSSTVQYQYAPEPGNPRPSYPYPGTPPPGQPIPTTYYPQRYDYQNGLEGTYQSESQPQPQTHYQPQPPPQPQPQAPLPRSHYDMTPSWVRADALQLFYGALGTPSSLGAAFEDRPGNPFDFRAQRAVPNASAGVGRGPPSYVAATAPAGNYVNNGMPPPPPPQSAAVHTPSVNTAPANANARAGPSFANRPTDAPNPGYTCPSAPRPHPNASSLRLPSAVQAATENATSNHRQPAASTNPGAGPPLDPVARSYLNGLSRQYLSVPGGYALMSSLRPTMTPLRHPEPAQTQPRTEFPFVPLVPQAGPSRIAAGSPGTVPGRSRKRVRGYNSNPSSPPAEVAYVVPASEASAVDAVTKWADRVRAESGGGGGPQATTSGADKDGKEPWQEGGSKEAAEGEEGEDNEDDDDEDEDEEGGADGSVNTKGEGEERATDDGTDTWFDKQVDE